MFTFTFVFTLLKVLKVCAVSTIIFYCEVSTILIQHLREQIMPKFATGNYDIEVELN